MSNPSHEISERNVCLTGGHGVDRLLTKLENRKKKLASTTRTTTNDHNQEHSFDSKGVDGVTGTATSNSKSTHSNTSSYDSATKAATEVADDDDGWFYHRSVWIDLTNDGRQSILTARAKRPSILKKADNSINNGGSNSNIQSNVHNNANGRRSRSESNNGFGDEMDNSSMASMPTKAQLVWLERPKPYRYDNATGTPLDKDGLVFDPFGPQHTPWKVRVLDEGPDVMFSVADLDTTDDTIEIFASQFFSKKLTLHSIRCGDDPKVVWRRVIDERVGASFSSILANLDVNLNSPTREVVDCGSTVPTLSKGDGFSHLLVTSHECTFAENERQDANNSFGNSKYKEDDDDTNENSSEVRVGRDGDAGDISSSSSSSKSTTIDGGSLFSYRVPSGKDGWRTKPWIRSVIATGFRVRGQLGNMINPGAPGFW